MSQSLSIDDAIAFDYNEAGTRKAFERDTNARMRKFGLMSAAFCQTSGMTREERKAYRVLEKKMYDAKVAALSDILREREN